MRVQLKCNNVEWIVIVGTKLEHMIEVIPSSNREAIGNTTSSQQC